MSALAKFERLLPARLRRRVSALQSHTLPLGPELASAAAPEMIARLALACRDSERVRFGYTDAAGNPHTCFVEPHCLISTENGWYLVAWDLHGNTWEAFRVNRVESYSATGTRFSPHELDTQRATEIVNAAAVHFARQHVGLLRIHALLGTLRAQLGAWAQQAWAANLQRPPCCRSAPITYLS